MTMEVRIQAIHFDISEKLVSFINKKVERLTRRFPDIINAEANLKVVKPETAMNKDVTMIVTVPQREEVVANKTADTFEEAVDVCLEAIERQLEKKKGQKK